MMWPFKWKLSACTFTWCYLFVKILENEMWKFCRSLPLATFGSERINWLTSIISFWLFHTGRYTRLLCMNQVIMWCHHSVHVWVDGTPLSGTTGLLSRWIEFFMHNLFRPCLTTFQKRSYFRTIKFSTTQRLECVVGFVVGMYRCESPCPSLPRIS